MVPHLGLSSKHGRKNLAYGTHILYMLYWVKAYHNCLGSFSIQAIKENL